MTCHVDEVAQKEVYPNCVIDFHRADDCSVAMQLVNEGKTREHCQHWRGAKVCKCCGQTIPEKVKK